MADNHICDNQGGEETKEQSGMICGDPRYRDLNYGDLNNGDLNYGDLKFGSLFFAALEEVKKGTSVMKVSKQYNISYGRLYYEAKKIGIIKLRRKTRMTRT